MASALARLTELKELDLNLVGNKIGPGPRRALCSDPEEVEARELQLHGTAYHCAGAERGSLGPRLSVTRGDAGAAAVAESLRNLRQLTEVSVWLDKNKLGPGPRGCYKRPYGLAPTKHVQAIEAPVLSVAHPHFEV